MSPSPSNDRSATHHQTESIVKKPDVSMSYRYYDINIRGRWKVQLRGWLLGVKFVAPGNITTMHEIRTLHGALSNGECRWVSMSASESAALANNLKQHPVVKTRKSRKRKDQENVNVDGGDGAQPVASKRRKRSTKSWATIEEGDTQGI